jgi:cytosine/creatinine deaminase
MKTLNRLKMMIDRNGGFVNAHAHFDRAYTAQTSDFENNNVNAHLFEKWEMVDKFKTHATEERYYNHISEAIYNQIKMGVTAGLTFIDCDPISDDRALRAALRAKEDWRQKFNLKIACQTLKGLEPWSDNSPARKHFYKFAHLFDVIGGLPRKDEGYEGEHIDILLQTAKSNGQRVHVHVDQLNCPSETETELLARKTMEHGMEGKVTAVHSISLAAHPKAYREEVYKMAIDAGLSFVSCPTAWIDHRRNETMTVSHNAITPIDEMVPRGITVAIGSDNICDVYKPFSDGDMMTELRFLLEATHFYDIDSLVEIATINGKKVMGLQSNESR